MLLFRCYPTAAPCMPVDVAKRVRSKAWQDEVRLAATPKFGAWLNSMSPQCAACCRSILCSKHYIQRQPEQKVSRVLLEYIAAAGVDLVVVGGWAMPRRSLGLVLVSLPGHFCLVRGVRGGGRGRGAAMPTPTHHCPAPPSLGAPQVPSLRLSEEAAAQPSGATALQASAPSSSTGGYKSSMAFMVARAVVSVTGASQ